MDALCDTYIDMMADLVAIIIIRRILKERGPLWSSWREVAAALRRGTESHSLRRVRA